MRVKLLPFSIDKLTSANNKAVNSIINQVTTNNREAIQKPQGATVAGIATIPAPMLVPAIIMAEPKPLEDNSIVWLINRQCRNCIEVSFITQETVSVL